MGLRLQAETSVTSTEKVPELSGVMFQAAYDKEQQGRKCNSYDYLNVILATKEGLSTWNPSEA